MPLLLSADPGEVKAGVSVQRVTSGPEGEAELKFAQRLLIPDLINLIRSLANNNPGEFYVVWESYFIYPNQKNLNAHRFSQVDTIKCIGALDFACMELGIPTKNCRAIDHKQAVTRTWLERYNFLPQINGTDNPHIWDAISVGVYWWRIKGLFNNGKRVFTKLDHEILKGSK